jgi:GNAT superfamily N-acetyltransferase
MTIDDLPAVFPLVERCYRESKCIGTPCKAAFVVSWGPAFASGVGLGFVARNEMDELVGFNIGTASTDPITGDMVAQELVLYALPEARGYGTGRALFGAFEAEARRRGAVRLFSGYVEGYSEAITVPMLTRRAFRPQERWWVKEL